MVRLLPAPGRACAASSSSRRACSARARRAGRPASCASRAARRRRCASGSGHARSTWASATRSAPTPGSPSRATCCPAFTEPEVAAARARIEMQRALGLPVRWLVPARSTRSTRPSRRARRSARPTAPRTATSPRRATSPPTPRRWSPSGVTVAERTRFTGLSPDGRTVRTSRGAVAAGRVILAGGPQLAAVGALAGLADPGGRRAAPRRGHRGAPGVRGHADGVRRAVRAVLAAGRGRPALRDERPG